MQPRDVVHELMILKYLERIGDHAVNLALWTGFILSGIREGNTM